MNTYYKNYSPCGITFGGRKHFSALPSTDHHRQKEYLLASETPLELRRKSRWSGAEAETRSTRFQRWVRDATPTLRCSSTTTPRQLFGAAPQPYSVFTFRRRRVFSIILFERSRNLCEISSFFCILRFCTLVTTEDMITKIMNESKYVKYDANDKTNLNGRKTNRVILETDNSLVT